MVESKFSPAREFIRPAQDSDFRFLLQTLNWSLWRNKTVKSKKGNRQESGTKMGKLVSGEQTVEWKLVVRTRWAARSSVGGPQRVGPGCPVVAGPPLKAQGCHEEEEDGDMIMRKSCPVLSLDKQKGLPPRDPPLLLDGGEVAWAKAPYSLSCWWQPCSPIDSVPLGLGSQCCGSCSRGTLRPVWTWTQASSILMDRKLGSWARLWPPSCSLASLPAQPSPGKHLSVCLQQEKETRWWWQLLWGEKLRLDKIVDLPSAGDFSPQPVWPVGPNISNLAQQPSFITYTALHPTWELQEHLLPL